MILTLLFTLLLALTPAEVLEKASALYGEFRYQDAVMTLSPELPAIRESGDSELLAEALSLIGSSYFRLGMLDDAIKAQTECYKLDCAAGDSSAISSSLNNLAASYRAAEDLKMAEKLIREAIGIEEHLGVSEALAVRYGMASDILVGNGKVEEAELYARKALQIDEEAGRESKVAVRKSQLAAALVEQGNLGEASDLLGDAYQIFFRDKNWPSLGICRFQQGRIAWKEGFENLAANYLREARELSIKAGNKLLQKRVTKDLATLLKPTDPQEASRYLQEYAALADSIFKEKTAEQLTEFKVKKEIDKVEQDIAVKEQEAKTLKLRSLMLMIVAILLASVLILVAWISHLRKKRIQMLRQALEIKERLLAIHEADVPLEEKHEEISSVIEDLSRFANGTAEVLTSREQEVARLCCEGLISKEIADRLGLSPRTVETHKNNIFRKLGIHTTEELIRIMKESKP